MLVLAERHPACFRGFSALHLVLEVLQILNRSFIKIRRWSRETSKACRMASHQDDCSYVGHFLPERSVSAGRWMPVPALRLLHPGPPPRLGPHAPGPPYPLPRGPADHRRRPLHRGVLRGPMSAAPARTERCPRTWEVFWSEERNSPVSVQSAARPKRHTGSSSTLSCYILLTDQEDFIQSSVLVQKRFINWRRTFPPLQHNSFIHPLFIRVSLTEAQGLIYKKDPFSKPDLIRVINYLIQASASWEM